MNYIKSYMNDSERRKKEVIPGIFDPVFKRVFTIVKGLIEEVVLSIDNLFTKEDMKNMKIINSEFVKETVLEKGKITDLIVEVKDRVLDIEMNAVFYEKLLKRNNEYISKVQSLYEDKLAVQINIDDFSLFDNESSIIRFQMMSDKGHIDKTFIVKYHVNLEVIENKYYNKEELTRLEKIFLMFKLKNKEELINLSKGDELMERIYEELDNMSKNKECLLAYDKYELEMEGWKEKFKKEGIEQGIAQGIKQGIEQGSHDRNIEIAKNMLEDDIDIKIIAKYTRLSIKEIESLKK